MSKTDTRVVLCGEAATGPTDFDQSQILRLRNADPGRNVNLSVSEISRDLITNVPAQFADLVEIATYVYVADQYHTRGGDGCDDMGANWRRPLHFEIPVRCLDIWQSAEVGLALRQVLSFLSEDEYSFTFRQYKAPPPLESFLIPSDQYFPRRPERVVLFSGGLDSLAGVVKEVVVDRRQVALVTHQSTTKLRRRLQMIRRLLNDRSQGHRPHHFTVEINKDRSLSREYTQRSRSFLYASLGATIARMCGLDEVRFYENGTVSLNLPISRQVVGAKATRTTHPRVLEGFARLFSLLAQKPFKVLNEFLWKTKGEVVDLIVQAGCGNMIEWSTSCTHTWEISNTKPHCGKCSQCIDRRFAVLAANAGHFERADTYSVDLLTDPRHEGEPRTMLASYVETSQQVAEMSESDFFERFGEVARVVRHLGGSADENARKVYDQYRRHGREVARVVDAALVQHAGKIRTRKLPVSSLLRLVHDTSIPGDADISIITEDVQSVPVEPDYYLRPRGQKWELRFAGHEVVFLNPAIGYRYLLELLRFPEKRFTVSELLVAAHGDQAVLPRGDIDDRSKGITKAAYAQRLAELDEDLETARENSDIGMQTKLGDERAMLLDEFKKRRFRGRGKRNNQDLNNIRNSVSNAVRRAMATIRRYDAAASAHLQENISLGFSATYQPKPPVIWSV